MATTLNPMPPVAKGSGMVDTLFSAPWFADGEDFVAEMDALSTEKPPRRRGPRTSILIVAVVAMTGLGLFLTGTASLAAALMLLVLA